MLGVSNVHPASPATLPTNHLEASSSHYLNPAQPLSPLRGTKELGSILEPGYLGSRGQWDMMRPQKGSISGEPSSGSPMYQLNSKPTGAELLEEHLGEIRSLRQRLEESICINDRLREQLEHRLSSTARRSGPTSNFYSLGLESTPQLYDENRVLREENQRLQAQLSHASRAATPKKQSIDSDRNNNVQRIQNLTSPKQRVLERHSTVFGKQQAEQGSNLHHSRGESMKRELLELRTKLSKQESLLQSTAEHLKTANQQKESMEQFILSQCGCPQPGNGTGNGGPSRFSTCAVNGQRPESDQDTRCFEEGKDKFGGEIPKGSAMHPSPVTLAFQEPCKKRSHQRSLKLQGGGLGTSNSTFLASSSEGQLGGNGTCFLAMEHVVPTLELHGRSKSSGLSSGAPQDSVGRGPTT
ncbi:myomegalin-like [Balaenoptera ricei]|uniref:myomegalin-like n=1 Tax=Balaenoptera ricei TaxID=2746895 RepID=UPI0028BE12E8|nr:myomegalin-like [Balaenoptera ricei]